MSKFLISVVVILTAFDCYSFPTDREIARLPASQIISTAKHLSSLYDQAKIQLSNAKSDLASVQLKYDKRDKEASDWEAKATKFRIEAHNNAKQRDVVVFGFAIFFSLWFGSMFGNLLSSLPQPWGTFAPWIMYAVGLGIGYTLGRYILTYLSAFIP